MNNLARTALLAGAALHLSGCLSLFYEGGYRGDAKSQKGDHYYSFYRAQTLKIVDLQQCAVAANYYRKKFTSSRGFTGSGGVAPELMAEYEARSPEDAKLIVDRCIKEQAPPLTREGRYKDLIEMYEALAELPVPQERKDELTYLSKTTKLLEARATADRGLAAWDEKRYGDALNSLSSAASTAKGLEGTARPEQIAEFVDLHAKHLRDRIAMLIKDARRFENNADTHHLALINYARAHYLSRDASHKRKAQALKKALLDATFYDYRLSVKGDSTVSRTASKLLEQRGIPGNTKSVRGKDLDIQVTLGTPKFDLQKKNVTRSGQYADGTELVMNPDYQPAVARLNRLQNCVREWYGEGTGQWEGSKWQSIGCYSSNLDTNKSELKRMQRVVAKTPQQVQETSYSTHRYDAVEHKWTLTIPMRQTITVRGNKKTYEEKLYVEHVDHTHGKVPILKLSAHTARGLGNTKMLENAGVKLHGLAEAFIKKDHSAWLAGFPRRGTRGQVVYLLMTRGSSGDVVEAIEKETHVSGVGYALNML